METLLSLDIRNSASVKKIWPDSSALSSDAVKYISFLSHTGFGSYDIRDFGAFSMMRGVLERTLDNSYQLDYQFTLDSVGYFWFQLGSFIENDEPADTPIELSSPCGNGRYDIFYQIQNLPEENALLQCEQNPPIGFCSREFDQDNRDDFDRNASFIFKVE
jgi:hypothetical protein